MNIIEFILGIILTVICGGYMICRIIAVPLGQNFTKTAILRWLFLGLAGTIAGICLIVFSF